MYVCNTLFSIADEQNQTSKSGADLGGIKRAKGGEDNRNDENKVHIIQTDIMRQGLSVVDRSQHKNINL